MLAHGSLSACTNENAPSTTGDPTLGGKADGATACELTGSWLASAEWSSFELWYFSIDAGKLTLSETDDLAAEDWPTNLLRDPLDPGAVTLMQITRGGDMIFQTTLNLEITGCEDGKAQLAVREAYIVSIDFAEDGDSVERHEVTLEAGTSK